MAEIISDELFEKVKEYKQKQLVDSSESEKIMKDKLEWNKNFLKSMFKDFTDEEMTDEMYDEYMHFFNKNEGYNLFIYIQDKGIKLKELMEE